jgi:hypothetical protein
MKDPLELAADNYIKNLLREDFPEKTDEEIETLFQQIISKSKLPQATKNAA